jgi:hypothetical protein
MCSSVRVAITRGASVPPLPVVPGVTKHEFLWTQAGIPAANVFHSAYTGGPPDTSDLEALATAINTDWWASPQRADYPSTTVFVGHRITDLSSDSGAVGEVAVGTPGTAEDDPISAQACVLINHTIARRYRGGHPRTYFPPPAWGGLATPSTWDAGIISDFTAAWLDIVGALTGFSSGTTDWTGVVSVSYRTANAPRVDPVVDPIVGSSVNGRVCTQRRRLTASSY